MNDLFVKFGFEEHSKIIVKVLAVLLLVASISSIVYSQNYLYIEPSFTHLFYIPIILSVIWFKRWGLLVPILLGLTLISSYFYEFRAFSLVGCIETLMFIIVGLVVLKFAENSTEHESILECTSKEITGYNGNIHDSPEYYRMLVEMAQDGIWLLDRKFMTIFINPKMEDIMGYSKEEMIGRSWSDFGDPSWVARTKELEKRREHGIKEPHEFLFRHKDGRKVLTRISTTLLYDKDGNFDGALGILSDITRQKEAQEALNIKDMLNSIAQSAGIGMCILNPDYTIEWYNDQYVEWFGPLESTKGKNCFEVFEGKDSKCIECPTKLVFEGSDVAVSERVNITTFAGSGRNVKITATPIRDASGNVIQVVEIGQDITEQKEYAIYHEHFAAELEVQVLEKTQKLNDARKALLNMVSELTESRNMTQEMNRQLEIKNKELGMANDEVQATSEELVATNEALASANEELEVKNEELGMANQEIQVTAEELITANEELLSTNEELEVKNEELGMANQEIQVTAEELITANEELLSTNEELEVKNKELGMANDEVQATSEELVATNEALASANDQLQEIDRMKSDFLNTMSHELRTPLTAIIGYSSLLLQRIAGAINEKQENYVDGIHRSGNHLLSLINEILDLSKIEAGKMRLNIGHVDVVSAINDALVSERPQAEERNQTITVDVDENIPYIAADSGRFKQILINLVSNAIKFTPDNGKVEIKAYQDDGYIRVDISDSGVGINEADISKLFKRFVQLDSKMSRQHAGTGLGLSIVAEFVKLMNGEVLVESECGKGSTFSIRLPVYVIKEHDEGNINTGNTIE